jgi:hypothetical protein
MPRAIFIAALLLGVPSMAAEDMMVDSGFRGEMYRSGGAFGCKISDPKFTPEMFAQFGYQPCLHIGNIAIGADAKPILEALGTPYLVEPDSTPGAFNHIYIYGKGADSPYLVITEVNDHVAAVQIAGRMPAQHYNFHGIGGGAPVEALLAKFGQPFRKQDVNGKELWTYLPWPFSFMVAGGVVASVRISNTQLR